MSSRARFSPGQRGAGALIAASIAAATLTTAPALADSAATKTVTYRGYQVQVPVSWTVVDLDRAGRSCIRFDQHTVYFGRQRAQPDCPATLHGRTEALLVEPLEQAAAPAATIRLGARQAAPAELPDPIDHELDIQVPAAGVKLTASYGADQRQIRTLLDSARILGGYESAAVPEQRTTTSVVAPGDFTGQGFDACTAPPDSTMNAWLASPFRAVGIYIGGVARSCHQPNLDAGWVQRQTDRGWHLLPLYVGHQAPCRDFRDTIDPDNAETQGRQSADDAVHQAGALGLARGSTLYEDMEGFNNTDIPCRDAVLRFLHGWTVRLHEHGYLSGVYSSAGNGIQALIHFYHGPEILRPDHVWLAHWNGEMNVSSRYVAEQFWPNRKRIKQYLGGHVETHGEIAINIDSNYVDVGP